MIRQPACSCCGRADGLAGVVQAFVVRAAVAAGESAGPLQAGHGQPGLGEQLGALLLADVGQLLPPDADAGNARRLIVLDIFFERPAKRGQFADCQPRHPCVLSATLPRSRRAFAAVPRTRR